MCIHGFFLFVTVFQEKKKNGCEHTSRTYGDMPLYKLDVIRAIYEVECKDAKRR